MSKKELDAYTIFINVKDNKAEFEPQLKVKAWHEQNDVAKDKQAYIHMIRKEMESFDKKLSNDQTISITRDMIMALPRKEACNLHKKMAIFFDQNYESLLDAGLIDDVLVGEYKIGAVKLDKISKSYVEEQKKQTDWLCTILWQMVESVSFNIASGHHNPIYSSLLQRLTESL